MRIINHFLMTAIPFIKNLLVEAEEAKGKDVKIDSLIWSKISKFFPLDFKEKIDQQFGWLNSYDSFGRKPYLEISSSDILKYVKQ